MLLSDRDLNREIDLGNLRLTPYDPKFIQPSSIDVRLHMYFRIFNSHLHTYIDPAEEQPRLTSLIAVTDGEPFILHPGEFALGSTLEEVALGDTLSARLEGKSSLGRLGIMVHSTAGFIDAGFHGHVTLELSNITRLPIKLWPGMKIGQLCVMRLTSPAERPYGSEGLESRYQGQMGPTASRSHEGWTLPS